MPFNPTRKTICPRCGKPMRSFGKIHDRCKSDSELYPSWKSKILADLAVQRAKADADKAMEPRTRHWNVSMGRKKLEQMFPDLASR